MHFFYAQICSFCFSFRRRVNFCVKTDLKSRKMDPVATCERRAKRAKRTRGVFICAFVAYLRVVRVRSCSSGDATGGKIVFRCKTPKHPKQKLTQNSLHLLYYENTDQNVRAKDDENVRRPRGREIKQSRLVQRHSQRPEAHSRPNLSTKKRQRRRRRGDVLVRDGVRRRPERGFQRVGDESDHRIM